MQVIRWSWRIGIASGCLAASILAVTGSAAADTALGDSPALERLNDRLSNERIDRKLRPEVLSGSIRIEPGDAAAIRARQAGSALYRLRREQGSLRQPVTHHKDGAGRL